MNLQSKWCMFWDTLREGSWASGFHVLISSACHALQSLVLFLLAEYYASEESIPGAYQFRKAQQEVAERMRQTEAMSTEIFEKTTDYYVEDDNAYVNTMMYPILPAPLQKIFKPRVERSVTDPMGYAIDESDLDPELLHPLLNQLQKDIIQISSLVAIGFDILIAFMTFILFIGITWRNHRILFIWVASLGIYMLIDFIYHCLLLTCLIKFEGFRALIKAVRFQMLWAFVLTFWTFRSGLHVYSFYCVTSFGTEITGRSGLSKVRTINDDEYFASFDTDSDSQNNGSRKSSIASEGKGGIVDALKKNRKRYHRKIRRKQKIAMYGAKPPSDFMSVVQTVRLMNRNSKLVNSASCV